MGNALACGRRFRTASMIDAVNRQSVYSEFARAINRAINAARLVRVFRHITRKHGLPTIIRSDNSPECCVEAFQQ